MFANEDHLLAFLDDLVCGILLSVAPTFFPDCSLSDPFVEVPLYYSLLSDPDVFSDDRADVLLWFEDGYKQKHRLVQLSLDMRVLFLPWSTEKGRAYISNVVDAIRNSVNNEQYTWIAR